MADTTTESQAAPAEATSTTAAPVDASQSQAATPATSATPAASTEAKPAEPAAAKTDDATAKPAEPAKEVVYEFKLPEGVEFKGELLDELKATAKDLGLTQEQAQRVADLGAKQAQGFAAQLVEQQKTLTAEWANQTTTDKEIGGDKLAENLAVAKKALDAFGSPELKTLLNQTGFGNHPDVVRFMVKAGKAISEDGKLITGSAAQVDRASVPIENRLYPNQK